MEDFYLRIDRSGDEPVCCKVHVSFGLDMLWFCECLNAGQQIQGTRGNRWYRLTISRMMSVEWLYGVRIGVREIED